MVNTMVQRQQLLCSPILEYSFELVYFQIVFKWVKLRVSVNCSIVNNIFGYTSQERTLSILSILLVLVHYHLTACPFFIINDQHGVQQVSENTFTLGGGGAGAVGKYDFIVRCQEVGWNGFDHGRLYLLQCRYLMLL
jgi:hypothetical protein